MITPAPHNLILRTRLVEMYAQCPEVLQEQVAYLLGLQQTPEDMLAHNHAAAKIMQMFPPEFDWKRLWHNVAQAVLNTATQTGVITDGKSAV